MTTDDKALSGHRVLVTGGSRRVGKSIALDLARRGAAIAVHYRSDPSAAAEVVREIESVGSSATALRADLAEPGEAERVVGDAVIALGGLTGLVNSAASFEPMGFGEMTDEQWRATLGINLDAPMRLSRHAGVHFQQNGGGRIVNIIDLSALSPWPDYIAHSVAKAGLWALTRSLARALAADRVTVNAVAPGAVLWPTEMSERERRAELEQIPAGRPGSANDVAEAVSYLIGASDFVTGTLVRVDGGQLA